MSVSDSELEAELSQLTRHLVAFKTTGDRIDQLKACIEFIKKYLSPYPGIKFFEGDFGGKPYIVATFSDNKSPKFFLSGHLDVVDASAKEFKPDVGDGKIKGRGAIDMKGPCTVLLRLFRYYAQQAKKPSIGLMFTTDEESAGRHAVDSLLEEEGFGCDAAIVPDGGYGFKMIIAEKGTIWLKMTVTGKEGHGSRPWMGVNAIEKAFEQYDKIKKSYPLVSEDDIWKPTINLGRIEGGKAINQIPDVAILDFEVRYTEEKGFDQTVSEIKELVEADIEVTKHSHLRITPKDHPLLISFKDIAEQILKTDIQMIRSAEGSDAKIFGKRGIPVIEIGPVGGNHHSEGEWVELKSLVQLYRIFESYLAVEAQSK